MEKFMTPVGSVSFLCGLFATFLLLCVTTADGTNPIGNVNLSPFQQWISAYECLQNNSISCQDKYKLTDAGWVNVTQADAEVYCKAGGCGEHVTAVLRCIHLVKPDYKFVNKASVQDVNNTIIQGCSHGFTGSTLIASNARKIHEITTPLLASTLLILFLSIKYIQ